LAFPLVDEGRIFWKDQVASDRQTRHQSAAQLASEFQKVIADFQKTELCHQLKTLTRKLFQTTQVNKIVAYGLSYLSSPGAVGTTATIKVQTQHAALLAIRDVWKEKHEGSFEIYLQDPQYWKIDEEVAAQFGMTVVNGDIGHQMGYLLIDQFTLVVDLVSVFFLAPLIFEITRPAGLLAPWPLFMDQLESEVIFSYMLTRRNEKLSRKEGLIFPGHGM
jgi:hypothetical protein